MNRNQKDVYVFLKDSNGKYIRAIQQNNGDYAITRNSSPYPLKYNPSNLIDTPVEFGTNTKYFSLNRSISYPLSFIKDGAAICRNIYFLGKGIEEDLYVIIVEWNGNTGVYELSYKGKIDFSQKTEDPKSGSFTVPTKDDSAWGILSENDTTTFSVDCSPSNPKAIRVVFDGITLKNKYTYQTVQTPLAHTGSVDNSYTIPFVQINEDGDSFGIVTKNQEFNDASTISPNGEFFYSAYPISTVTLEGDIQFEWDSSGPDIPSRIDFTLRTSQTTSYSLFSSFSISPLIKGKIYKSSFSFNLSALDAYEKLYILMRVVGNIGTLTPIVVTPIVTNISLSVYTKSQPVISYGLRPLDLVQELVSKATYGRFGINSDYFTTNNKSICFSGDAIRGVPNARIYSSFADFFQTFSALYYMALRSPSDNLAIELANEVYKQGTTIIDLEDAIDFKTIPADDYSANEISVGSPKQDYRHPSGRLEFNSTNTFSMPIKNSKKKLDFVTKYRTGCYDIQFLIMDYQGSSTKDNSGDKSVYVAEITDEQGYAVDDVETFESVTIDNALLEPIIKSPLTNDTISNNLPIIRGISPQFENINIYADTVLDGNTTADIDGNWSYQLTTPLSEYIPSVQTGEHIIQASFTDLAAPNSSINITIDTSYTTGTNITYPNTGDSLYNNLPLVKGVGQAGVIFDLILDTLTLLSNITVDNSCKWEYKFTTPLSNGGHILTADTDSSAFDVDSNVSHPLITYIGSELDGFVIQNNLPLIRGVALPGTLVHLFLNYITHELGEVVADSNGDWSFQVVPVNYPDPGTGIPIVLAPIQNGVNIISTSLTNFTVPINVAGYLLDRPDFDTIEGVIDNSVFNTKFSPMRCLLRHSSLLASILNKQRSDKILFQTADKNGNLRTILDGVEVDEDADINASSLGNPLFLLEYGLIKTKTLTSFVNTLSNFNNGGVIKTSFRGTDLYFLPIGGMKMSSIKAEVQEWKLLMSPLTSYSALLNLYKNGLTINLMKNSLFHSDYNSLHFVTYNFQDNPKYNFKTRYDDWFANRNDAWIDNPTYIQKFQTTEIIRDQIISNGISSFNLLMYRCSDAFLIATIAYSPVSPAPIPVPEVVFEALVDLSAYPEDQYFFVLQAGILNVCISERIQTKDKWYGTILLEATNSINYTGVFFSTGFQTLVRVEGLVKKLQSNVISNVVTDESGNTELIYSQISRKRIVRFGTAFGLPDYLYLKIANALAMDLMSIEGVDYSLESEEKIQPAEEYDGHPMYFYNVNLLLKENSNGKMFAGADESSTEGVVLVIDAEAFGLPTGSLINIALENE